MPPLKGLKNKCAVTFYKYFVPSGTADRRAQNRHLYRRGPTDSLSGFLLTSSHEQLSSRARRREPIPAPELFLRLSRASEMLARPHRPKLMCTQRVFRHAGKRALARSKDSQDRRKSN